MSVEYEFIDILMNVNKFKISRGFAEGLRGGGGRINLPKLTHRVEESEKA